MNTIDMSFTFEDAKHLTKKMHARYGDGFARQWKGFTANKIANELKPIKTCYAILGETGV